VNKLKIQKVKGIVVKGSGEGTKIGIPTANISTSDSLEDLEQGVYATTVTIDDKIYGGVAHYGPRAVFNEYVPQLEVHIFKFKEMIYGKTIEVEFLEFIRPTVKFNTIEDMLIKIKKDIQASENFIAQNKILS